MSQSNSSGTLRAVKNPLFALIGIAKENDADDMSAKKQDYLNEIFAVKKLLNYAVVFQTIETVETDDTDSKENEQSSNVLNYEPNKMEFKASDEDNYKRKQYKVIWNEKEIEKFGEEVYDIMKDEKKEHDGLFMILSWYGKPLDPEKRMEVWDSKGNKIEFYKLFEKAIGYSSKEKKLLVCFQDAYRHIDSLQEAIKVNQEQWKICESYNGGGHFRHGIHGCLLGAEIPYARPQASSQGGEISCLMEKVLKIESATDGKTRLSHVLMKFQYAPDSSDLGNGGVQFVNTGCTFYCLKKPE